MTTIRHNKTLVYYEGVQVFAGQDAGGNNYVGAMIDTVGDADRYLVVAAATESLAQLYAGDVDLRTLLLESSADGWYTALVDDDFQLPVSLEPQSGSLLEMDYLPEAGVHLGKVSSHDLIPANPASD
jgi:hypothetical protein